MTHELKIHNAYFEAVKSSAKTFEVRKDDRGFAVGDTLRLVDLDNDETLEREVGYILPGGQYGLAEGYVVLGLRPVGKLYAIKSLEWKHFYGGWIAHTPLGYVVVTPSGGKHGWSITGRLVNGETTRVKGGIAAAKSAAWDAYVSRVEQALEVVR